MALNKQVFRTRALSAIFFVILMLCGLLLNRWSFLFLFSIIHFGCWWEYLKLIEKIYGADHNKYTRLGFMISGYAVMLSFANNYLISGYSLSNNLCLPLSVSGFLLLLIALVSPGGKVQKAASYQVKGMLMSAVGLLYISLCWGMMIALQFNKKPLIDPAGEAPRFLVPGVLIASIWINDTMAYIVGSFIGKTPFSPVSPKKTWEGTIGGAVLCVVVMSLAAHFLLRLNWVPSVAIPLIAAIVGTAGDLLESKLKRLADVKDSGKMMPGHGGFLDRFDSMLLATPFVFLYLRLFI